MERLFCIITNCCAVQRSETYRIENFFCKNGWIETSDSSIADINVITTCGVTNEAEEAALQIVDRVIVQSKPNSTLVISGCLPNICNDELIRRYPTAILIPLDKFEDFNLLICANHKIQDVVYNNNANFHHSEGDPNLNDGKYSEELDVAEKLSKQFRDDRILQSYNYATQGRYLWKDETIFEIKISSGCNNNCSYCASRLGVGDYRSKDLNKIRAELESGIKQGYKKIMLMGDELGAFGCDIGCSLIDVIKLCVNMDPNVMIGIRYIHPDRLIELYEELEPFLNNIFFCCISVQSASPNVLKLMNRNDNIESVSHIIKSINRTHPHIFLHTQIIIGFPNETNEDFEKTISFLRDCKFDYIRYNVFSPRRITQAYFYDMVYSDSELKERIQRMKNFCEHNRIERLYKRYCSIICEK